MRASPGRLIAEGRRAAIISGGELTVTLRGRGRGGPNQEYALALAIALDGQPPSRGACRRHGRHGWRGRRRHGPGRRPRRPHHLAPRAPQGLDAAGLLAHNDSTRYFETLDDLLVPGPTRTNVNDCRIILIG